MDPALRAALSRGFEDVGVPGEAGAEGGRLSAARCDQQYLDPGLRAAMAAMGSGFSCMQDEDEGRPSAARRTVRACAQPSVVPNSHWSANTVQACWDLALGEGKEGTTCPRSGGRLLANIYRRIKAEAI